MPSWSSAASRGALALIAVLGPSAVSACRATAHGTGDAADASGLPVDRPVAEADLLRLPEAALYFPGSTAVRKVGADQSRARSGEEPNPAYEGAILTVSAGADQLYRWYGDTLRRKGFRPATDYRPSTQVSGEAWQFHRRLQVQVGVFDPQALEADQGIRVTLPAGTLVYEMVLVGYAPGLPKTDG